MNVFDWREYFILAQNLSRNSDEASMRSAVSRAYFAAYCVSRNYATTQGLQITRSGRDHWLVRNFYYQQRPTRIIAVNLGRLYRSRGQCDYENSVVNLQNIVQLSLSRAQLILQLVP